MTFRELANALETAALARSTMPPGQYADLLENIGNQLLQAAAQVRAESQPTTLIRGGLGEQVRIQVFGPSGELTQQIERG